jgi:hypothetical protein
VSPASQGKPVNQGWRVPRVLRVLRVLRDKPAALASQANPALLANLALPASPAQPGRRQANPDGQGPSCGLRRLALATGQ